MSIIETPWWPEFEDFVSSAKTDLLISTPFFSSTVLNRVFDQRRRNVKIRLLLGKITSQSLADGTTDRVALEEILRYSHNIECRCIENLHAKVLVADSLTEEPRALITSSNLTREGLQNNVEFGIMVEASLAREIAERLMYYWNHPKAEPLNARILAQLLKEAEEIERRTPPKRTSLSLGGYVHPKGTVFRRIIISERVIRQAISEIRHASADTLKERRLEFESLQRELLRVLTYSIRKDEFETILRGINHYTGALRTSNMKRLLENEIGEVNKNLRIMLDESKPLNARVDSTLRGKHKLVGGALGFISAMLFISDRTKYNIYNQGVLKGLRRVFGSSIEDVFDGETYEAFNSEVQQFKMQFGLEDVEADWLLWYLSQR